MEKNGEVGGIRRGEEGVLRYKEKIKLMGTIS